MIEQNIRCIELPIPGALGAGNVYVVVNGNRAALIDTGMASEQNVEILTSKLGELGHSFASLDKVLCTHYHPDHCGLARQFQDAGTDVFMSKADRRALVNWQQSPAVDKEMAEFYGEHPLPEDFCAAVLPAFEFLRTLQQPFFPMDAGDDGSVIELAGIPFDLIETPGHTDGHMCLVQREQGVMITGDQVLPDRVVNIALRHQSGYDSALLQYLHSLKKIIGLGPLRGLPGHGGPINDVSARCAELLILHQQKVDRVEAVLTAAPRGAYTLSCQAFGEKRRPFSKWLNMAQTVACLEYLASLEKVNCHRLGNMLHYSRIA